MVSQAPRKTLLFLIIAISFDKNSKLQIFRCRSILQLHIHIPVTMTASVCPGGQLVLTCHTNETVLRWTFSFRPSESRSTSSSDSSNSTAPLIINETTLRILRTSISPLTSTLFIDNVTADLNGTMIFCSYRGGNSTTIIHVIGEGTVTYNRFPDMHNI